MRKELFKNPIGSLVGKTFNNDVVLNFLYVGRSGLNYYSCYNRETKTIRILNQKLLEGSSFLPITEIETATETVIQNNFKESNIYNCLVTNKIIESGLEENVFKYIPSFEVKCGSGIEKVTLEDVALTDNYINNALVIAHYFDPIKEEQYFVTSAQKYIGCDGEDYLVLAYHMINKEFNWVIASLDALYSPCLFNTDMFKGDIVLKDAILHVNNL